MQPLFGSPRITLVLIQLQSSSSSPGPRHQGRHRLGRLEGAHTPPQRNVVGSISASPSFSMLDKTCLWECGASLAEDTARKVIYSSKILLSFPPSDYPIKSLWQDSASPRRELDVPAAEGGSWGSHTNTSRVPVAPRFLPSV